jgi:SAM-dependent methyltransferase
MIDQLAVKECSFGQLPVRNLAGRKMLVDLLAANNVICINADQISLTTSFRQALMFRELLEAKMAFAEEVAKDISSYFPLLIDDLSRFMESSVTFQLFRYDRCFEVTPSNMELAQRWMRYTTALTRHEGRVLAEHLDLRSCRHLLDIGGNSGELAVQLCRVFPQLWVTAFDLPVVCQIGRDNVEGREGHDRIIFRPGDMRHDELPTDMDAVTLKSLLHDWPDENAQALLAKAQQTLRPGGLLTIFERAPLNPSRGLPYAQLANLVFFQFFRPADLYLQTLGALRFTDIRCETIRLEMDFHLITARRSL